MRAGRKSWRQGCLLLELLRPLLAVAALQPADLGALALQEGLRRLLAEQLPQGGPPDPVGLLADCDSAARLLLHRPVVAPVREQRPRLVGLPLVEAADRHPLVL